MLFIRSWFSWLLTVRHPSADVQRRARNTIIIAFGHMLVSSLFLFALAFTQTDLVLNLVLLASAELLWGISIVVARRGYVTTGVYLICMVVILTTLASGLGGKTLVTMFFLLALLPIVSATLLPRQIWIMLGILFTTLIIAALAIPGDVYQQNSSEFGNLITCTILLVIIGLISYLGARSTAMALWSAQDAQKQAQQASTALEALNTSLEERVTNRTESLQYALAELSTSLEQQQRLNKLVQDFVVPIIPVLNGVLIVPLIGMLDMLNTVSLNERVLQAIETLKAHTVFLDLTGAALVDTHSAELIIKVALAAKLLGAEMILIGIRPELAQSLVSLGIDLSQFRTAASLHSGLAEFLTKSDKSSLVLG